MERMNKKKLIMLVKANPSLYDKQHPQYQDKDEKQKLWVEIGKQMNFPANVCKLKWNNLRDCYRRTTLKNENSYLYSRELSFLFPNIGHVNHFDDENASHSDDMWGDPLSTPKEEEMEMRDQISLINSSCQQSMTEPRRSEDFNDQNVNFSPLLCKDHVDYFLAGIAPALKCLSRYNLCKAKAEIFQVVSKYELKSIEESESPVTHINTRTDSSEAADDRSSQS